jgi:hypothetical protein
MPVENDFRRPIKLIILHIAELSNRTYKLQFCWKAAKFEQNRWIIQTEELKLSRYTVMVFEERPPAAFPPSYAVDFWTKRLKCVVLRISFLGIFKTVEVLFGTSRFAQCYLRLVTADLFILRNQPFMLQI